MPKVLNRTSQVLLLALLAAGLSAPLSAAESVNALDALQARAEAGQSEAQWQLGTNYEVGNGVEADVTMAAEWYRKAADQGNSKAQFSLGSCYENGMGVPLDYEEAAPAYPCG